MEFRLRDYASEAKLHALPRQRAEIHPLSAPLASPKLQANDQDRQSVAFYDPLRGTDEKTAVSDVSLEDVENYSSAGPRSEATVLLAAKEWSSFTRLLMQRFPTSKMLSVSSKSGSILNGGKTLEKSSTSRHVEQLEDPTKVVDEGLKVISRDEYICRLHELKDEITHAWNANDRVTALKLAIKVARLLMDTSVLQFYPSLFVLATDILDMLGNIVWERIKSKAEFAEDGTRLCSLSDNFEARDVSLDAKETCNNWFCKIGAIQELLPRIYLELAILPCWRFLLEQPVNCIQRLLLMVRGIANPLASAYCRLYIARSVQKLPSCDTGLLVTCINDMKSQLMLFTVEKETASGNFMGNKTLIISLMEPTFEYLVKCIFKDSSRRKLDNTLFELGLGKDVGSSRCASVVLHHLLKEIPIEVVSLNAERILQLIECSNDPSFSQYLNYRLLGLRLCEKGPQLDVVSAVLDNVFQIVTQYEGLDEYVKVMDAYVDIILQNQMDHHLKTILEGISLRACKKGIAEDELLALQSILVKLISHYQRLEDVFSLNHFLEILDLLYGSSRSIVSMHMLNMATRNSCIRDSTTIQLLFEISQALHDGVDLVNLKEDDNQPAHLITRFAQMVEFGSDMERHLAFLVECRGAFSNINELKETLVHSSNCLAIEASKDAKKQLNFVKACVAFNEVTLPSISAPMKQLTLYLETAEVALLCGLLSHSDGLIDSAISCLLSLDIKDGSRAVADADGITSSIEKLCSLLVMAPGNLDRGITYFPKSILSFVRSQAWMTLRMRARIFCAILSLLATYSQNRLPYHADHGKFLGNDILFFGDSSYLHELVSFSELIIQDLVDAIKQEPSKAARGRMALEACNCLASIFNLNGEAFAVCSELLETAKLGLSAGNKYLQSTIHFIDKNLTIT